MNGGGWVLTLGLRDQMSSKEGVKQWLQLAEHCLKTEEQNGKEELENKKTKLIWDLGSMVWMISGLGEHFWFAEPL